MVFPCLSAQSPSWFSRLSSMPQAACWCWAHSEHTEGTGQGKTAWQMYMPIESATCSNRVQSRKASWKRHSFWLGLGLCKYSKLEHGRAGLG